MVGMCYVIASHLSKFLIEIYGRKTLKCDIQQKWDNKIVI